MDFHLNEFHYSTPIHHMDFHLNEFHYSILILLNEYHHEDIHYSTPIHHMDFHYSILIHLNDYTLLDDEYLQYWMSSLVRMDYE